MLLTVGPALECEAICSLAEHRLASGLNTSEAGIYVDGLMGRSEPVRAFFRWRSAVPGSRRGIGSRGSSGRADAIVTFNESHLSEARRTFGIDVIGPAEALARPETCAFLLTYIDVADPEAGV